MKEETYPDAPGFKREGTSQEAATAIASRGRQLRQKALEIIKTTPHTADEVASTLGESILSIRPRCSELARLGKIQDSGERRLNTSFKRAIVWRAV